MMRALLVFTISAIAFLPGAVVAGGGYESHEIYRGHYIDLSAVAGRKDSSDLADGLRHQIDIVENSGLSPRVLQFFQTFPIAIDDFACAGMMTTPTSGAPAAPALSCVLQPENL